MNALVVVVVVVVVVMIATTMMMTMMIMMIMSDPGTGTAGSRSKHALTWTKCQLTRMTSTT